MQSDEHRRIAEDERGSDRTLNGERDDHMTNSDRLNEKLGSPVGQVDNDGQLLYSNRFFDPELAGQRKVFFKTLIGTSDWVSVSRSQAASS